MQKNTIYDEEKIYLKENQKLNIMWSEGIRVVVIKR
jgi:hypothetical protein